MSDFNDVNGRTITPGCIVVVAVKKKYGGTILRKGLVTRTQIGPRYRRGTQEAITLRSAEHYSYIGTYRNAKAMMIVDPAVVLTK